MEKIYYPDAIDLNTFKKDINNPKVLYGLPKEILFCKKCLISNQRPNSAVEFLHTRVSKKDVIHFDEHGVCDACNFTEQKRKIIDWDDRDKQLRELCDIHRKNDGSYDCVVPGSGGKDSFYASHILRTRYGMHKNYLSHLNQEQHNHKNHHFCDEYRKALATAYHDHPSQ
jgi:hypothetical protein